MRPSRVDDHFADRAETARSAGWQIALVDTDAPDSAWTLRGVRPGTTLVLQGWMLTVEAYAALAATVTRAGARLLTDPERYARAHQLPGWYEAFRPLTPASTWLPAHAGAEDLRRVARELGGGPIIVKDWVKSRKHEWESACYAPTPAAVPAVVAEMLHLQGDDLTGGVVLREFEDLREPEVRVWWVEGEPVLVTAHPDTPDAVTPPDLSAVGPAVHVADCPFVTTDLAQRTDGVWRVIEVGDGQVSDFPCTGEYSALLAALKSAKGTGSEGR